MKLVKSLLLGSAAGLAAVAGANAADLPAKKAVAAVEYVRVCSTYGAGFFYIPGTDSCMRIGGRVRADYRYVEQFNRANDTVGFRVRGRIQTDVRTQTAYGLLRTFVRFEIEQNSGSIGPNGTFASNPYVAEAFVQFGGLTAGKVVSFWDNPDLPTQHFGTLRFSDAPDVALLAYTFSFGNGFSATLSLEDGVERRVGQQPFSTPFALGGSNYAGQNAPDLVGNVRYSGTWGSAQLNGAIHQTRGLVIPGTLTPTGVGIVPDTEYGYAIGGSVGINLPMLGAGDAAWVAAQYVDGALGYITGGQSGGITDGNTGGFLQDVFYDSFGNTSRGRGWSIAGGLTHNWTPTVRTSIFGSWADINYSGAVNVVGSNFFPNAAIGVADFREYRIGGNVIWSPVSGLNLGLEVIYANIDRNNVARFAGQSESGTEGRIRVQRDF